MNSRRSENAASVEESKWDRSPFLVKRKLNLASLKREPKITIEEIYENIN
jgi:hypothetical protein